MNREVYIYSQTNDYIQDKYISKFKDENATLIKGTLEDLTRFIFKHNVLQLDVETNVTDKYLDRELYVVQLGDKEGDEQHIFDIKDIPGFADELLRSLFANREMRFIAHNGKFEYIVLYKHYGIYIYDFDDTFLMSKLLSAGLDIPTVSADFNGFNSLANQIALRIGVHISKDDQTTFDGEMMTPSQLIYATTDVLYMGKLYDLMMPSLKKWQLVKKYNLERRALRPIGDLTINGVLVDTKALKENIVKFTAAEKVSREIMEGILANEPNNDIKDKIFDLKAVQREDEVVINWGSPKQKKLILQYMYPEDNITSSSIATLNKLVDTVKAPHVINLMLVKDWDSLSMLLVSRHMGFLKDNGFFIKKGYINLNFNSPSQLLALFKIWYPNLSGVGVKDLARLKKSPLIEAYKDNAKASKLVSSFGEKMFSFIEADGRIHGSFSQLVPSGSRMSSSRPNLQQMPSNEEYRRIFIPSKGGKLVDSDYSSAEIYLAAYMAMDKKMIYAIKKGYDMHSYSASLIFGQEWLDAGGDAEPIGKPKTKAANKLRKASKALSFSLFYGTGVKNLSENLKIPVSEGKELMAKYYSTFPELAAFFKASGNEALNQGFVREPFFGGIRFFRKARNGMEASHNKNAGMNYKPQSGNGSVTKYALALMKVYIEKHDLDDKVKIILTIHDQIVADVLDADYAPEWAVIQTMLMEKAALPAVPGGELKAESMILDHWTK